MNDRCVFCGTELRTFQKKRLSCGPTTQILCAACYEEKRQLNVFERAEAALNTNRATDPQALREYLAPIKEAKAREAEEKAAEFAGRRSELDCLRCGKKMIYHGSVTFKLGEETFFFSDFNRLMSGSLELDVYRCEGCGKVEFFAPDADAFEEDIEA